MPIHAAPVTAGPILVVETAEARVLRLESHVRLLARTLKRRLPQWIGIEADDLMQAGLMAVWRAGDLPKTAMRRRIWWAMLDSVQGRQHQKLARIDSMDAPMHGRESPKRQYADRTVSIEQRLIAREEFTGALSRPEQRAIEFKLRGQSQADAARAMQLCQQRVSQLQRSALQSLRRKMAA